LQEKETLAQLVLFFLLKKEILYYNSAKAFIVI